MITVHFRWTPASEPGRISKQSSSNCFYSSVKCICKQQSVNSHSNNLELKHCLHVHHISSLFSGTSCWRWLTTSLRQIWHHWRASSLPLSLSLYQSLLLSIISFYTPPGPCAWKTGHTHTHFTVAKAGSQACRAVTVTWVKLPSLLHVCPFLSFS